MLTLISLGLADEQDLSLRGVEAAKACASLYAEAYTMPLRTTPDRLQALLGKPVRMLDRHAMEDRMQALVREARERDVGILVGGDALAATTHTALLLECRKQGIPTRVVHGSSIFTAVAETGLSLYKFGETISIPFWQQNYKPAGFYQTVLRNRKEGLHTLLLLDTAQGGMTVPQALAILQEIERRKRAKPLGAAWFVACSRLGGRDQVLVYAPAPQLSQRSDLLPPAALVLPGKLNAFEEEFLDQL
ncbi:MAG: diphthine synthase [Candidatus Aenigmarchaeota archaeon]|nr:diphthine synthase [Candidatus Aenigmarchaeota archaeon]